MRKNESEVKVSEQVTCEACRTIPISHLPLDLSTPMAGWVSFFAARGVEVVTDDVGRPAIPREVLGQVIGEKKAAAAARTAESERRRKEAKPQPIYRGVQAPEGAPLSSALAILRSDEIDEAGYYPFGHGETTNTRKAKNEQTNSAQRLRGAA